MDQTFMRLRTVSDLREHFTNPELLRLVWENHPGQKAENFTDLQLFKHTYIESNGPQVCELTESRLNIEFNQFMSGGDVPLYFVRSLLPNFCPGSA